MAFHVVGTCSILTKSRKTPFSLPNFHIHIIAVCMYMCLTKELKCYKP